MRYNFITERVAIMMESDPTLSEEKATLLAKECLETWVSDSMGDELTHEEIAYLLSEYLEGEIVR